MTTDTHNCQISQYTNNNERASLEVEIDYRTDAVRFVVEYSNYNPNRDKSKPSRFVHAYDSPSAARAAYDAIAKKKGTNE